MNKKAFFLGHLGLGDNITCIGIVRYLREKYDIVMVVCKYKYKENLELIYSDDDNIKIFAVNSDNNISPAYGVSPDYFKAITNGYDIYMAGFHKHGFNIKMGDNKLYDLPFSFYDDCNVPYSAFWNYFHIPIFKKTQELYEKIKHIKKYVFAHNITSQGKVFDVNFIEKKLNISKEKILIINPCENMYSKGEEFYELAQLFVGLKLPYYIKTIENAWKIIITDSSFMCMSINLELDAEECYIYSRPAVDGYIPPFKHIWSDKYIFNKNLKRKIFKSAL